MAYGTVKVDNVTFTYNAVDATTTFSGFYASTTNNLTLSGTASAATFTGTTANFTNTNAQNISVTTLLSGLAITGGTAGFTIVTGTTVTGTTANFVTVSGTTVTGTTAQFTSITGGTAGFTTITGTTVTGTTANFVTVSGTTVTGTTASFTSGIFTSLSGTTHTITSGVFALGTAALPSISFVSDPNTGIYSPGADQVAVATNGTQRLTVDTAATTSTLPVVHPLGAVGTPSITFTGDLNTGVLSPGADQVTISTGGTGRLFVDASGNVGVGITPAVNAGVTELALGTASTNPHLSGIRDGVNAFLLKSDSGGTALFERRNLDLLFGTNNSEKARITSAGLVGIGTSSPSTLLTVQGDGTFRVSTGNVGVGLQTGSLTGSWYLNDADDSLRWYSSTGGDRFTISSTGNVGIGVTSPGYPLSVKSTTDGGQAIFDLNNEDAGNYGGLRVHLGNTDRECRLEATYNSSFFTFYTAASSGSGTERARIDSDGRLLIGTTNDSPAFNNVSGVALDGPNGLIASCRDGNATATFGRKTNDGDIVEFYQDGTKEGSISVSGTTVSYNGAHLSRWSQLPSGAERTEILRGTVLSNIDQMCEWGEEDNEQLNRMKVSTVEGDKNVSGVFQAWDDDDDTYTNDFYCAMTGDFIIRISEGVTVERGDLLTSAGDGTAKPQDDDIIRSKTIAKVTSTNVSCTYEDGSYCVPCVLMAC